MKTITLILIALSLMGCASGQRFAQGFAYGLSQSKPAPQSTICNGYQTGNYVNIRCN